MSEDAKIEDYEATFSVVMPGQVKASTYKIHVKAASRMEAHIAAEEQWEKMLDDYSISVSKIKNIQVA
jgi:hypothetical protein